MKIIFIPGLGYDCRIFDRLDGLVQDAKRLEWIEPEGQEPLHAYAERMVAHLDISPEETVFIGHSLGGIVVQQIASVRPVRAIILISSLVSRNELPLSFKIVKPLRLDRFFTRGIAVKTVDFWGKNHGFETVSDRELFKSMVGKQSNAYLQWALRALSTWRSVAVPPETKIFRIHGTNDKTLPYSRIAKPDFTVRDGSHICVYKNADRVAPVIRQFLSQFNRQSAENR